LVQPLLEPGHLLVKRLNGPVDLLVEEPDLLIQHPEALINPLDQRPRVETDLSVELTDFTPQLLLDPVELPIEGRVVLEDNPHVMPDRFQQDPIFPGFHHPRTLQPGRSSPAQPLVTSRR
jgi:hypothetical protein